MGAAAGAATLAATSTGDLLFLGVVLGVVAAEPLVAVGTVTAALAVTERWGSSSLAALAGNQAVLGPAGAVGPVLLVASVWLAAAALIVAAPAGRVAALAFGLAAANVVAGPSASGAVVIRVVASLIAVGVAWACGRWLPRAVARPAAPALAAAALLAALAG